MARIGKYSGKVYDDNQIHLMNECGILIPDSKKDDKSFCENVYKRNFATCATCKGCNKAKK